MPKVLCLCVLFSLCVLWNENYVFMLIDKHFINLFIYFSPITLIFSLVNNILDEWIVRELPSLLYNVIIF